MLFVRILNAPFVGLVTMLGRVPDFDTLRFLSLATGGAFVYCEDLPNPGPLVLWDLDDLEDLSTMTQPVAALNDRDNHQQPFSTLSPSSSAEYFPSNSATSAMRRSILMLSQSMAKSLRRVGMCYFPRCCGRLVRQKTRRKHSLLVVCCRIVLVRATQLVPPAGPPQGRVVRAATHAEK